MRFENAELPPCTYCQSKITAYVQVGVIDRTICINGATTKFRLLPNGPKPGKYYSNDCGIYIGEATGPAGGFTMGGLGDRSYQAFVDMINGICDAVGIPKVDKPERNEKTLEAW